MFTNHVLRAIRGLGEPRIGGGEGTASMATITSKWQCCFSWKRNAVQRLGKHHHSLTNVQCLGGWHCATRLTQRQNGGEIQSDGLAPYSQRTVSHTVLQSPASPSHTCTSIMHTSSTFDILHRCPPSPPLPPSWSPIPGIALPHAQRLPAADYPLPA